MIPQVVKQLENRHFTVKLEIKRANIEEKSFTYIASGIYETVTHCNNNNVEDTAMMDNMEQSVTQVTLQLL